MDVKLACKALVGWHDYKKKVKAEKMIYINNEFC